MQFPDKLVPMEPQVVHMELEQLKAKKEKYITGIFWLCLQIAVIFGIPAAIAAYFGVRLDIQYETGRKITLAFLAGAFILSWILIIWRYNQINKKIKNIDLEIKNHKEKNQ